MYIYVHIFGRFCTQDKLDKINRFKLSVQYFNSQKLVASENAKKMKKRIPGIYYGTVNSEDLVDFIRGRRKK